MGIADDVNDDENWAGGFYELCLILGAADDDNVDRALRFLWRAAGVQGCHVRRADGAGFAVVELGVAAIHAHGHLRGTLTLPSGARVVCGGFLSRYEGLDTLELYLPLGALARVDRRIGGYPFDESSGVESLTWRSALDRWLADVAIAVYAEVPFHRALIGFEIDEDRDISGDERYAAVLRPCADGLEYRPANA
ncbi:hypothetical protein [Micromonospora sp. NBS 11-29]|uniref:hypothetical protein n=1 Tax=Micromonospora sp. NBS 11-29 TaxID=1960879 RepID=UPI000B78B916|nr:hypothetical protein [Micromonospora sp. NBS 11-29]